MLKLMDNEAEQRLAEMREQALQIGQTHRLENNLRFLNDYGSTVECLQCSGRGMILIDGVHWRPFHYYAGLDFDKMVNESRFREEFCAIWSGLIGCLNCKGHGYTVPFHRSEVQIWRDHAPYSLYFEIYRIRDAQGQLDSTPTFWMNGALIYHGFDFVGNPPWSTRIDDSKSAWSIHT